MADLTLDTNCVVRLLLADVPEQHRAVKDLLSQGAVLAFPDAVVAELVFVLARHYGVTRAHIAELVVGLLELEFIVGNVSVLSQALADFVANTVLSFEDCYLASLATAHDSPLVTFDVALSKRLPGVRLLEA